MESQLIECLPKSLLDRYKKEYQTWKEEEAKQQQEELDEVPEMVSIDQSNKSSIINDSKRQSIVSSSKRPSQVAVRNNNQLRLQVQSQQVGRKTQKPDISKLDPRLLLKP